MRIIKILSLILTALACWPGRALAAKIASDSTVNGLTNYNGIQFNSIAYSSASSYATTVTVTADGGEAWVALANGKNTPDAAYTSVTLTGGLTSQLITFSGFSSFAVPSGSVIDGVVINIRNKGSSTGTIAVYASESRLNVNGSQTNDRAFQWNSSASTDTLGSATDLWGLQSSVDAVYNHIDSLKYLVKVYGVASNATATIGAYIDAVKATVYWHKTNAFKQFNIALDFTGNLLIKNYLGVTMLSLSQDGYVSGDKFTPTTVIASTYKAGDLSPGLTTNTTISGTTLHFKAGLLTGVN